MIAAARMGVGTAAAKELSRKFRDLDTLLQSSHQELIEIDGVGDTMAESILEFFRQQENIIEIEQLIRIGLNTKIDSSSRKSLKLNGKTFVLTGSLVSYTRQQAAEIIESQGGKVLSAVSSKTNYLVAGPGAGSKLEKAKKFGVETLSEEEFIILLGTD